MNILFNQEFLWTFSLIKNFFEQSLLYKNSLNRLFKQEFLWTISLIKNFVEQSLYSRISFNCLFNHEFHKKNSRNNESRIETFKKFLSATSSLTNRQHGTFFSWIFDNPSAVWAAILCIQTGRLFTFLSAVCIILNLRPYVGNIFMYYWFMQVFF